MILLSRALRALTEPARHVVRIAVREIVAIALSGVDLTEVVCEHLDIDAVVARVDLDRIVNRLDLDGIIESVQIEPILRRVLSELDIPEIVRESTGSLSSGAVWDVRSQGVRADDAVAGFIGRLLHRDARVRSAAHAVGEDSL
ncbi:hypothetical protein [Hoyosella altamirensis]|uniref:Uncharacterized protein n=2 Tax=Hoyosella altamirensis TaxID=616997 RepID=A0A839RJD7_9ACTN|nr:hypothetical protein [Hoyosella altamirensis]MBB3036399.1 hypothetical protein [Hoyosella altamirensis]